MKPYYQDNHITIYNKDCRDMSELADNSVQCVVTSPPYWGLRKYSGEQDLIWGGDENCEHAWAISVVTRVTGGGDRPPDTKWKTGPKHDQPSSSDTCSLCGAWRGSFGLEPTPEMYVQHTIEILREIRRVLRKDGVVFWNIGDSYWGGKGQSGQPMSAEAQQGRHGRGESINQAQHQMEMATRPQDGKHNVLKPKDLCLIPQRVAVAAQEDGWWVRKEIIWNKPNPMPESVKDRPTSSHEQIWMFTKSAKYYWDKEAVKELYTGPLNRWGGDKLKRETKKTAAYKDEVLNLSPSSALRAGANIRPDPTGRNIRSVWTFATQPYPEAHFAVFPEKLPELCIKAASKEGDIILDPFAGAGTTLWVAKKLNRMAVGYDLSSEYCDLAVKRNMQQVLV